MPSKCAQYEALGEKHFQYRQIPEAIHWFQRALDRGADPRRHAWHRWQCWMLVGDFERAWEESDRSQAASFGGRGPVQSSRVVVRCLRGFGDAIQFLRFARELRKHCSELVVQAPVRVLPLLRRFPGVDLAVPLEENLAGFDFEIECSDLPYLFRTTLSTLPPTPHLVGIEPGTSAWTKMLKVGIAWAAGEWNACRSIPLEYFGALTDLSGTRLFSLQPWAARSRAARLSGIQVNRRDGTRRRLHSRYGDYHCRS